jgi:proteasome lid subunit RPN8/RPN11
MSFPLDRAIEHAAACYPMEACGIWVESQTGEHNGAESDTDFIPCPPSKALNHFSIQPSKWLEAERAGTIKGIFHVHPDAPPIPSQNDLVSINAWGLPWVIMSWPSGEWAQHEPEESASRHNIPLLGRWFQHGSTDCFGLIRDYYKRLGIELPDFERWERWEKQGFNLYLDNYESAGFSPVKEVRPHDVLLFRINSPVPNHGAVYLGDNRILQHLEGRLSSRAVYGDFYQKYTTHILRHRELC